MIHDADSTLSPALTGSVARPRSSDNPEGHAEAGKASRHRCCANRDTSQRGTTLRYRCQVECPSTGRTMSRPTNNGIDPITRPPATISPQMAIGPGFATTARTDVHTAASSPTSRSSSSGNDTTLIASTSKAKRKPTPTPTQIITQPAPVVNTSRANAAIETGGSGPRESG